MRGMRDSSSERGRAKAYGCVFASSSAFKGDSMESMLKSFVRGGAGGGRGAPGGLSFGFGALPVGVQVLVVGDHGGPLVDALRAFAGCWRRTYIVFGFV